MRIAVVTTSYPTSPEDPSGHFVRAEVRALLARGHEITLLVPAALERSPEPGLSLVELPHLGLFGWPGALERLRVRPWKLLGGLPFVRQAREVLRNNGPFDELVAHWLLPSLWPIARDFAERTTVVVHGSDVGLVERLPRPLQRRVLRSATRPNVCLRAVSWDLRRRLERLAQSHALAFERVQVEPCALELPELADQETLRRTLAVTNSPLVVVVGRVVKDKRLDCAIRATLAAFGQPPTIIGDGPERPSLMQAYPHAQWLGALPHELTLSWIKAADILLSASQHEGAPTVVREARLLGTRVVAEAAGDLERWAQTDSGMVVVGRDCDPDPVARLANALKLTWTRSAVCAASVTSSDESTGSRGAPRAAAK